MKNQELEMLKARIKDGLAWIKKEFGPTVHDNYRNHLAQHWTGLKGQADRAAKMRMVFEDILLPLEDEYQEREIQAFERSLAQH